jgi:hypothetical protein
MFLVYILPLQPRPLFLHRSMLVAAARGASAALRGGGEGWPQRVTVTGGQIPLGNVQRRKSIIAGEQIILAS